MFTRYRQPVSAIALLGVLGFAAAGAHAQTRQGADVDDDVPRAESMKQNDEEDGESADRPPERPGIEQFEEVTVERERPDALPAAEGRDVPDVLRGRSNKLPKPPSRKQLQSTTARLEPRVYQLVATQKPRAPGDATTLIHRGHAVLVSDSGARANTPILITTYFWLRDARELYLVPKDASIAGSGADSRHGVQRRSLQEVSVDGREDGWLTENRDELVEAKLYEPDEDRNLVTVVPQPVDALDLPDRGLQLFDLQDTSPTRLYGYTPHDPKGLRQTKLLESHPDQEALVYYFQTTFRSVFGAPIVSTDGRLLVLTAFKHPKDPEKVLTIPPKPIAAYVSDVLDIL